MRSVTPPPLSPSIDRDRDRAPPKSDATPRADGAASVGITPPGDKVRGPARSFAAAASAAASSSSSSSSRSAREHGSSACSAATSARTSACDSRCESASSISRTYGRIAGGNMHANDAANVPPPPPPWLPLPRPPLPPAPPRPPPPPPAVAVAVRVRVGIRTAAGIRTDARARSGLAREPAVQSGQARGRHRSRELLVRLPRGASLDEPRGYQLREPARVLEVDAGEELARFSRRERRDVRAVVRAVVACGPFYTSDCRGGVQRRQVELKGAEGGD